ncbi:MAG: alkaline phytoceramidase [Planctomycetes bacterium]|nr:alkaline phytoceramidase [Planctomycetota bacterium]
MLTLKHNRRLGVALIALISVSAIIAIFLVEPLLQEFSFHDFSDKREFFGVRNFFDIASNLPFLIVGILGVWQVLSSERIQLVSELRPAYLILFAAVAAVAFCSSYYHFNPNNESLVWDRLPMTLAFMSLLAIVVGEMLSAKLGRALLWPLIAIGLYSIYHWVSADDLRVYVLVQFLPMLLIPVMLFCFRGRFDSVRGYWLLLLAYGAAKLFEYFDVQLFEVLGVVSGHSLKHVAAALGVYGLLKSFSQRQLAHM